MRRRVLGILRQYTSHWNTAAMKKQWKRQILGCNSNKNLIL